MLKKTDAYLLQHVLCMPCLRSMVCLWSLHSNQMKMLLSSITFSQFFVFLLSSINFFFSTSFIHPRSWVLIFEKFLFIWPTYQNAGQSTVYEDIIMSWIFFFQVNFLVCLEKMSAQFSIKLSYLFISANDWNKLIFLHSCFQRLK